MLEVRVLSEGKVIYVVVGNCGVAEACDHAFGSCVSREQGVCIAAMNLPCFHPPLLAAGCQ
jgi:hypothetical protein